MIAETRFVSPSYFGALRIPLLTGELCRRPASATERSNAPEMLVNRSFAEAFLGGRAAVGLHLIDGYANRGRIVGVVGDARETGLDHSPSPVVYACLSAANPMPMFLIRTRAESTRLVQDVRNKVREISPLRSVHNVAPLQQRIRDVFAQNRLRTILLTAFAAAALALACLGVYGTLTYVVTQRRREIGLVLALGARRSRVVASFVGKALSVVGIACAVGLVLLFAFSRALSGMLFGVSAADPATLLAVIALVLGIAALAAAAPAARAAAIDPMRTLREE
jgi:putative ABC transport system permease protein